MLIDLLDTHGGDWIFTAPIGTPGTGPVSVGAGVRLHPVDLDERLRSQHYDTISINLILGMLHYLHDTATQPVFDQAMVEAWVGYETVNRIYAKRLAELVEDVDDELILINDPHLMLVPEHLAEARPRTSGKLAYFLGTPWCEPDYFGLMPEWTRVRLLESLLHCDVVGFHSGRWVDAFLACCARNLPDARISGRVVRYRGRTTTLVSVPFPLDVDVLEQMRGEEATLRWAGRLAELAGGRRTVVRADRLDLWKNLPRGFLAYEALLERDPALAEECLFVSVVTTPSRAAPRHQAYQDATEAIVDRVNRRFGAPGRDAIALVRPGSGGDSRNAVVAALCSASAAIVNSTYDGLNLFAKEAAYLLAEDSPLLVSANAGVHEQLAGLATTVDPFDIDQTSRLLEAALRGTGRAAGRAERHALLRAESTTGWLAGVFGS
ncbi:trehalose-6-phosphate synthase [Actinokineospora sp. PR83]|uniref:trehalose-6-phosphate synthase n=1 Tax=Actinokineospora sp. PR83 TaxID=2884908 RepID=UPI001F3CC6BB|nr:trehalose-6-phosphate synthase [Actinokineospora sp. PR83]MCG8917329.1 trehalose-6-phosphate synthase [Actinokineospora sp. PR83]